MKGRILKGIGGFYYVDTPDGMVSCKARGKFRKTVGKPVVGDLVELEKQADGTGYLLEIFERQNSLIRPAVANLDLVVVVATEAQPKTDSFLIDKVIAIAENKNIEPCVILNKTDLNPNDTLYAIYQNAGIPVFRVSTVTGEGVDAVRQFYLAKQLHLRAIPALENPVCSINWFRNLLHRPEAFPNELDAASIQRGMWSWFPARAVDTLQTPRDFLHLIRSRWILYWQMRCNIPSVSLHLIWDSAALLAALM